VLEKIQKSEFAKNVLTLVSGSSIAQLIPFAVEPVLSRMFTPAEFGVFEFYTAIIVIIGSISTARYEMAIILPKYNNDAINILGISLISVVIVTLALLITGILFTTQITDFIGQMYFKGFILVVPLGILLIGVNRSFLYWSIREKYMRTVSFSRIFESAGKASSSIMFGIARLSSIGLIFGQLIGQVLSLLSLVFPFIIKNRHLLRNISKSKMKTQAQQYSQFPKVNVAITISEMFQISGLIFVFSLFFDVSTIGEISKSIRILLIPMTLITTSIAQVFYQKATKEYSQGIDISKNLKKIISSLLWWSLPGLILFLFISPWLFGFVLGRQWIIAGEYARILSFWIFVKFIISPITIIPLIINKQKEYFLLNLVGNVILIVSITLPGIYKIEIYRTLIIFSFSQIVFLVFLYFRVMSIYNTKFKTS